MEKVLRGVVRTEHLSNPEDYVVEVLARCKTKYVARTYKLSSWTDHIDFLEQMAKRCGRLGKGGEPDINAVSKMVLNDWTRGKLPFFTPPPGCMMEPKPEDVESDNLDDVQEEDEEDDEKENEVDEDDLDESDTDTVATTDTTDTSATVDSLFENVRFPEEKEEVVKDKLEKPKINLGDLIKQDLRKIVTSVDYFDEEKYESGKKIKNFHKIQKESEDNAGENSSDGNNVVVKPRNDNSDEVSESERSKTSNDDLAFNSESSSVAESSKRKSPPPEITKNSPDKKVKTSSGMF